MKNLQERIQRILSEQDGNWGVAFRDLATDQTVYVNEDHRFGAASIIKIPIMMEIYRQADQGILSLSEHLILDAKDVVGGCGVLQGMQPGLSLTIRDAIVLMITISDNTATNMLIDRVGIDSVNRLIRDLGAEQSVLRRKLMMTELMRQGIKNELTPKEVLLFLDLLAKIQFLHEKPCMDMIEILKLQQLNHKIPLLLPDEVVVAHKTGEDSGITHNAGILYYKEQVMTMCVLSEGVSDTVKGHYAIAQMAKAAFEEILAPK